MSPQPASDGLQAQSDDLQLFCLGLFRFFKLRLACGAAFTSVRTSISVCVCVFVCVTLGVTGILLDFFLFHLKQGACGHHANACQRSYA